MSVRPKLKRLAGAAADAKEGVFTVSGYSTAHCLSRTLDVVLGEISRALEAGRTSGPTRPVGLLRARDACLVAAGTLMAAAEQAQRDYESATMTAAGLGDG